MAYNCIFSANQSDSPQHGKSVIIGRAAHIMRADSDFRTSKRKHMAKRIRLNCFPKRRNACIIWRIFIDYKGSINFGALFRKVFKEMKTVVASFRSSFGNEPHIAKIREAAYKNADNIRRIVINKPSQICKTAFDFLHNKTFSATDFSLAY